MNLLENKTNQRGGDDVGDPDNGGEGESCRCQCEGGEGGCSGFYSGGEDEEGWSEGWREEE